MKASGKFAALVVLNLSVFARGLSSARELTFEDRVKAQEAIERVYWSHRIWPKENPGPKPSFEAVTSTDMVREKVRHYLAESTALERLWSRRITATQLQAEMDRMA